VLDSSPSPDRTARYKMAFNDRRPPRPSRVILSGDWHSLAEIGTEAGQRRSCTSFFFLLPPFSQRCGCSSPARRAGGRANRLSPIFWESVGLCPPLANGTEGGPFKRLGLRPTRRAADGPISTCLWKCKPGLRRYEKHRALGLFTNVRGYRTKAWENAPRPVRPATAGTVFSTGAPPIASAFIAVSEALGRLGTGPNLPSAGAAPHRSAIAWFSTWSGRPGVPRNESAWPSASTGPRHAARDGFRVDGSSGAATVQRIQPSTGRPARS